MANLSATGGDEPKKPSGSISVPKSKRGAKGFLSGVSREMKKVSWPTHAETVRLTTVVLSVCLMLVVILTAMGFVFQTVVDLLTKGSV